MEEAGRDEEHAAYEEHAAFVQEFEFMTGRPWPRNSRLLVQSERQGQPAAAAAAPAAAPP